MVERQKLRDDFVQAYKNSTGKNLLELSKYAKEQYYDPIRKDMRKYLGFPDHNPIFSAATFRNFIFRDDKSFSPETKQIIGDYIEAVANAPVAESKITNTILNDYQKIENTYEGLAKALLYYFVIKENFNIEISWEAFLKLADYYNGDNEVSKRFYYFNIKDPIGEILDRYIKTEQLLVPYKVVHSFKIDMALLDKNPLLEKINEELELTHYIQYQGSNNAYNPIANEILKILLDNNEMSSASDLNRFNFNQKLIFMVSDQDLISYSEKIKGLSQYSYQYIDKRLHEILKFYYSQANEIILYRIWATRTLYLMICFPLENYDLIIIIENLLKKGCRCLFFREFMDEMLNVQKDDIPAKLKEIKHRLMAKFYDAQQLPKEYYNESGIAQIRYFNVD